MIRGTNTQFKFKLPYKQEELAWATIKFWQPGNTSKLLPITKKLDNCSTSDDPKELCVALTAEETMRFVEKYRGKTQLRAQTLDGTTFGSKEYLITIYPMSDDILDEDPIMPSPNKEGWVILDGGSVATE